MTRHGHCGEHAAPALSQPDAALARARAAELTTPSSRDCLRFNPQAALAGVQCPVLLLNGTDDPEVDAVANLSALEKGLKTNRQVVATQRLPGVNH